MPRGWDKLDKSVGKTSETLRNTTAALLAQQAAFRDQDKEASAKQNRALKKARETRAEEARVKRVEREETKKTEKEQRDRQRQILATERQKKAETKQILQDTKSIGRAVAKTTVDLFKWVGISEAIVGLAGFGSLWGIADLAGRATDMRQAALSLGTTAPGQEAANIFLSPFLDVNKALGGIAAAKADMGSWWAQSATGVPFAGMDPVQALLKLLPKAQDYVKRPGYQLTEQDPTVMAFEAAGISIETLRALQGMSKDELANAVTGTAKGMKSLNEQLGSANLIAWTKLQVALHNAGVQVEATLIQGLLPLAKVLPDLTDSVVGAVKAFFGTHDVKDMIASLGVGIKNLADYLATGSFLNALKSITHDMHIIADDLMALIAWLKQRLIDVGLVQPDPGSWQAQRKAIAIRVGGSNPLARVGAGWGADIGHAIFGQRATPSGGSGTRLPMGLQMGMANTLINFLKGHGVSDAAARGSAAGAFAEGGFSGRNNSSSGAFQLGQWLGPRKMALMNRYGPNPTFQQQMEFLLSELRGGDRGGPSVLGAHTAEEALRNYIVNFMRPHKGYETERDLASGGRVLPRLGGPVAITSHIHVTAPSGSHVSVQAAQLSGAAPF